MKIPLKTVLILQEASKKHGINKTKICDWFPRFKNSNFSLKNQPRSG